MEQLTKKGQSKLNEWLGGLSLTERIACCEQGSHLTCLCCGYTIFDKELDEQWIKKQRKCPEHIFVTSGYCVILGRSFRGFTDVVGCNHPDFIEQAVLSNFKRTKYNK